MPKPTARTKGPFGTWPIRELFDAIFETMDGDGMDVNEIWSATPPGKGEAVNGAYLVQQAVLDVAYRWKASVNKSRDQSLVPEIYQGAFESAMFDSFIPTLIRKTQEEFYSGGDGIDDFVNKAITVRGAAAASADAIVLSGDETDTTQPDSAEKFRRNYRAGQRTATQMSADDMDEAVAMAAIPPGKLRTNPRLTAVKREDLLQLAVASAAYQPVSKRPKSIGSKKDNRVLTYRRDLSTDDLAVYTLPGDPSQGGFPNTIFAGARGTDSLYQMFTDSRMVLQRTAASTRWFSFLEESLVKVLELEGYGQLLVSGHSLGGVSSLEFEAKYANSVQAFGMVIAATAFNPYLNSNFVQRPDTQTIYSTEGDYCSGGYPSILAENPDIIILEGAVVDAYTPGWFESVLGKHSLDLIIQQTNSITPDFLKSYFPSYVALDEHTEHRAKLLNIKQGGNKRKDRQSFERRVNDAAKDPKNAARIKRFKTYVDSVYDDTDEVLLLQAYTAATGKSIKSTSKFTREQIRDKLEIKLWDISRKQGTSRTDTIITSVPSTKAPSVGMRGNAKKATEQDMDELTQLYGEATIDEASMRGWDEESVGGSALLDVSEKRKRREAVERRALARARRNRKRREKYARDKAEAAVVLKEKYKERSKRFMEIMGAKKRVSKATPRKRVIQKEAKMAGDGEDIEFDSADDGAGDDLDDADIPFRKPVKPTIGAPKDSGVAPPPVQAPMTQPIITDVPIPSPQKEYVMPEPKQDTTNKDIYDAQTKAVEAQASGVGIAQFTTKTSPLHESVPSPFRAGVAALFVARGETLAGYKADNQSSVKHVLQEMYGTTKITTAQLIQLSQAIVDNYGALWSIPVDTDVSNMEPVETVQTLACMLMRYRLLLKEKSEQQRGVYGGDGSTAGILDIKTLAAMNDSQLESAVRGRRVLIQVSMGITANQVRSMLTTAIPVGGSGPSGAKAGTVGDDRVKAVETIVEEPKKEKEFSDVMQSFHHGSLKYPTHAELFKPAYDFTFIN